MKDAQFSIWTIGHSTRSLDAFLNLLHIYEIKTLVDIRAFPGSRRFPHFNKESLSGSLSLSDVHYHHLSELGGRRKPQLNSSNTIWRNASFRGYADYMETAEFKKGIKKLEELARQANLVYMCSEATWWTCHRALVSDHLKSIGWKVLHIMGTDKCIEHPYTAPAKANQGSLFFDD